MLELAGGQKHTGGRWTQPKITWLQWPLSKLCRWFGWSLYWFKWGVEHRSIVTEIIRPLISVSLTCDQSKSTTSYKPLRKYTLSGIPFRVDWIKELTLFLLDVFCWQLLDLNKRMCLEPMFVHLSHKHIWVLILSTSYGLLQTMLDFLFVPIRTGSLIVCYFCFQNYATKFSSNDGSSDLDHI